ncbi:predicted protein [Histoplasma capsulatum var. duboisii H88]|uniref:Predicted protein n=2 Tax=Ajellomyces capsulatus TaxID=5037 RepID=F0U6V4_AJEC8|nr:predicted protein [Histoplasma capsulatum H143]EGC41533.1 predicted protein [Histoplasma capsulatum var. duboisii H88]
MAEGPGANFTQHSNSLKQTLGTRPEDHAILPRSRPTIPFESQPLRSFSFILPPSSSPSSLSPQLPLLGIQSFGVFISGYWLRLHHFSYVALQRVLVDVVLRRVPLPLTRPPSLALSWALEVPTPFL